MKDTVTLPLLSKLPNLDFEYTENVARAICVKFQIDPNRNNYVGSIGNIKSRNNISAISSWVASLDLDPNSDNQKVQIKNVADAFVDYWDEFIISE